ncbi:MAG TPA: hypothetical protein VN937_22110 [Blastocatellia bacterium]|nr:hypothetical protein [Blastocatellia bacterium]
MALEKELETYDRELQALLANEGEGKFVLIQDAKVVDVFGTYEDAIKAGYAQFGLSTPFLVKQLQSVEQIHSITRHVTFPCHT